MILDLHGQPLVVGIGGQAFGHRPGDQYAANLEPEVVVLLSATYLWGYLFLFALEAATVFCNDYFDYPSDRVNRNYGPFTGGSRVGIGYDQSGTVAGVFTGLTYVVVPHAALCLWLLHRLKRRLAISDAVPGRIDALLFVTLNYMVWFVAVPFYWLL